MRSESSVQSREGVAAVHDAPSSVGVVVIGRNEGDRLERCLKSVRSVTDSVVYVDSGSIDGSVDRSRALGVTAIELDMSTPFTAARARNEGFRHLLSAEPTLDYVFFVDGDCEVVAGWLDEARAFLDQRPEVAIVWGRRRERHPEKSIYNLLCDLEWQDTPVGETKLCGGDAVARVDAFQQVDGYRSDLICGEEPELCVRLRQSGWHIWHLGAEMTRHDAALYRFGQWWKRMLRAGYAYAQGAALHGTRPERHWVYESRRAWFWGLGIPVGVLCLSLILGWRYVALLLVYPLQVLRLTVTGTRSPSENWWRALAMVLCKFPEMLGQLKFLVDQRRRLQSRIIEYK